MTDIDERVAALLRDAAAEGGRSVRVVELTAVLLGLYQFVVLVPLAQSLQSYKADGRATVFEADGAGWKFVGYLPVLAPASGAPAAGRAVVQFTGSYAAGERYLVEVTFNGTWLGPLPNGVKGASGKGANVDLCATVLIAGQAPGVTTTIAST